jgi:guanidinobutyrase
MQNRRLAAVLVLVATSLSGGVLHAAKPTVKKAAEQSSAVTIEIPSDLKDKLKSVPADKLDYIKNGKAERYIRSSVLFEQFRNRTPAEIEATIDAMQSVDERSKFSASTDQPSIRLDADSPSFNAWKTRRRAELDLKREPGPIHLERYMNNWWASIPTFANAPVALTPEDLRAGKVDIAIVGAPLDMGSGYRGAKYGPVSMRKLGHAAAGNDMYTMIDPTTELVVVDYGDIAVDNMSTERTVHHVRDMVREIAATGAIPFIVGGDHSLAYPDIAAVVDVHGKGKVGVVHFDAHYDAGRGRDHLLSHGQPVWRLVKEGLVPGKNYVQVGLRAKSPDVETFNWMREQGFRYHTMPEVEKKGWEAVMKQALAEAKENTEKLFISFDVDVVDPAFMTGTGTPVPNGLLMREALPIVRRLCAETNLVGFEIVEVAPLLDSTYATPLNSNYIMHACMTGVAMRRKGITQEHYLSPLATEHVAKP